MRRAVLAWAVACGCATPPRATTIAAVELAPVRDVLPTPAVLAVAQPAATYDEPLAAPAPSTQLADAVAAALGAPARDPRLDLAAGELAALAQQGGVLDAGAIELALRGHGLVETTDLAAVSRAASPEAAAAEIAAQLGDRLHGANVRIGAGGGTGRPLVVVAVHTSLVAVAPLPRLVPLGGSVVVRGRLNEAFHAPSVVVSRDDTRTVEHPQVAKLDRQSFEATVACGARPTTTWILLEGHDPADALTRLALFPVACGTPPAATYRVEPRLPAPPDRDAVERRLLAIINRERAAAGLPALAGDLRALAAARTQAQHMAAAKSVAHALMGTTSADRLRDANLVPPALFEATLHAPDVTAAAEILMNERGYREIWARPELTHAAAGVAYDAHGEMFVALELVRIVPPVDTARLAAQILARINATRGRDAQLVTNHVLDSAALRYTRERANGWSDATAVHALDDTTDLSWGQFKTVHRSLTLLLDGNAAEVDLGLPRRFDATGIAVVQSPRNGALAGRVWVTILYARWR